MPYSAATPLAASRRVPRADDNRMNLWDGRKPSHTCGRSAALEPWTCLWRCWHAWSSSPPPQELHARCGGTNPHGLNHRARIGDGPRVLEAPALQLAVLRGGARCHLVFARSHVSYVSSWPTWPNRTGPRWAAAW